MPTDLVKIILYIKNRETMKIVFLQKVEIKDLLRCRAKGSLLSRPKIAIKNASHGFNSKKHKNSFTALFQNNDCVLQYIWSPQT